MYPGHKNLPTTPPIPPTRTAVAAPPAPAENAEGTATATTLAPVPPPTASAGATPRVDEQTATTTATQNLAALTLAAATAPPADTLRASARQSRAATFGTRAPARNSHAKKRKARQSSGAGARADTAAGDTRKSRRTAAAAPPSVAPKSAASTNIKVVAWMNTRGECRFAHTTFVMPVAQPATSRVAHSEGGIEATTPAMSGPSCETIHATLIKKGTTLAVGEPVPVIKIVSSSQSIITLPISIPQELEAGQEYELRAFHQTVLPPISIRVVGSLVSNNPSAPLSAEAIAMGDIGANLLQVARLAEQNLQPIATVFTQYDSSGPQALPPLIRAAIAVQTAIRKIPVSEGEPTLENLDLLGALKALDGSTFLDLAISWRCEESLKLLAEHGIQRTTPPSNPEG